MLEIFDRKIKTMNIISSNSSGMEDFCINFI